MHSKQIDQYLLQEKILRDKIMLEPRVLVLGSGDSGKTTLMKQLKILHAGGYCDQERQSYNEKICDNIVDSMLAILALLHIKNISVKNITTKTNIDLLRNYFQTSPEEVLQKPLTADIAQIIQKLWADEDIKGAFYSTTTIQDTAPYFLADPVKFTSLSYKPTDTDILNTRLPTIQVSESIIKLEKNTVHFFDVGGQQKYRKQWIPYFDDVHNIVFVVSISSYDQQLQENSTINRMHDALDLFGNICNAPLLKHTSMTLMLNKSDIFATKIAKSPINKYFPDYKGGNDIKKGYRYFEKKFILQNQQDNKRISTHITCCTDTKAMDVIISTVLTTMLSQMLHSSGFI
ncbi:hypothetical protein QVD99_001683 [Batrachochytrium dendrobatidis]|nr:hypothetical protein QVD99_001683 [Batrachochytrium dendrobatidis]